jgi:hypothetical protein
MDFYINLRKDLQEINSGIKDSVQGAQWNNATENNSSHKYKLKKVFKSYIRKAGKIGFYIRRRHADCGLPSHKEDYVNEKIGGQKVDYEDPRFVLGTPAIDQDDEETNCPCSSSPEKRMHHVLYDIVYEQSADSDTCETLDRIFCNLQTAIDRAGDTSPRSGIRDAINSTLRHLDSTILGETLERKIR